VSPIFLLAPTAAVDSVVQAGREFSAIPIIPATRLTIEKASTEHISIATIIGASWSSDRADGLIPTVVTDERGISLGLVYSSEESVAESLKTGTGVYQSRKRGLWYKGATSGDIQELVRISLDCDQDCLKFVVRQKGKGMYEVLEVGPH
jgi:phosphoribosyl-ATP pyrophosphohydrolase/phosphoribosyl-AMP cyclohydrolase/histidinol dehydrogenase